MPHYADGTLAKVGDKVKGTTYNQPNVIEGTIKEITSEHEACNCVVEWDDGGPQPARDYTAVKDLEKVI